MRFEHLDPDEAVLAHLDLGATRSIGFTGRRSSSADEEPYQIALDRATRLRAVAGLEAVPIGRIVDVPEPASAVNDDDRARVTSTAPALPPVAAPRAARPQPPPPGSSLAPRRE